MLVIPCSAAACTYWGVVSENRESRRGFAFIGSRVRVLLQDDLASFRVFLPDWSASAVSRIAPFGVIRDWGALVPNRRNAQNTALRLIR